MNEGLQGGNLSGSLALPASASREGGRPAPATPLLRVYFLRLKNRECRVNGELWLVFS